MERNLTLLNFDKVYQNQTFYRNHCFDSIDFESLTNASLFCERETLKQIDQKLDERRRSNITFIGSGNYHYVSYLLQAKMKTAYTLILFDHHTDTLKAPSDELISCGSWVLETLQQLPMLKKVIIIGVSEDAKQHIPLPYRKKVIIVTENSLQSKPSNIIRQTLDMIPTDNVYISVDKDVLDKKDAITGWDHGTLRLEQLTNMITKIGNRKNIIGSDVCGEYPLNPTNQYTKATKRADKKNDIANGCILETIEQSSKSLKLLQSI